MKKNNLTTIIFILFTISNNTFANNIQKQAEVKIVSPNIVTTLKPTYDTNRKLITPDRVLLAQAIKQYQEGYNGLAMVYFRKSAALGNSNAQTQLGLMHIKALGVPRNWTIGFAWIRMAAQDKTKEHLALKDKIYAMLTDQEKQQSELEYQAISEYFSRNKSYANRTRWATRVINSVVGSRVGGQTSRVVSININGTVNSIEDGKKLKAFDAFVDEFDYGIVESSKITPVEKAEEESK